jgi:hypothetical protein
MDLSPTEALQGNDDTIARTAAWLRRAEGRVGQGPREAQPTLSSLVGRASRLTIFGLICRMADSTLQFAIF